MTEPHSATDEDRMLDEAHRLSTRASILDVEGKYDEAHALASRALEAGEKALGPITSMSLIFSVSSDSSSEGKVSMRKLKHYSNVPSPSTKKL